MQEIDIQDIEDIKFEGYPKHVQEILELSFKCVKEYLSDENSNKATKFRIATEFLRKNGVDFNPSRKSSGNLKLRFEILKRDNFTCVYCGRSSMDGIKLQIDHIKPSSLGGKTNCNNLVTACVECNLGKRDWLLSDRNEKKLRNRKIFVKNDSNTNDATKII